MGDVIELRPKHKTVRASEDEAHVTLSCEDGVHVFPISYFEAWLAGDEGVDEIEPAIMRAIVREWIDGFDV